MNVRILLQATAVALLVAGCGAESRIIVANQSGRSVVLVSSDPAYAHLSTTIDHGKVKRVLHGFGELTISPEGLDPWTYEYFDVEDYPAQRRGRRAACGTMVVVELDVTIMPDGSLVIGRLAIPANEPVDDTKQPVVRPREAN